MLLDDRRRLWGPNWRSAVVQLWLGLPPGLLLDWVPQHRVRLLLLPGVTSLRGGSTVVHRERRHLLYIHQNPVLRLGVSLDCVGITGGVATIVTPIGRVGMETVLVFGQIAALL